MSESTTSKRATDPQDKDYRALKRTKFMSEHSPSTLISSTLPNLKRYPLKLKMTMRWVAAMLGASKPYLSTSSFVELCRIK
jgi:hypothetical protein